MSAPTTFGKYRLVRQLQSNEVISAHHAALEGPGGFERTCVLRRLTPAGVQAGLSEAFAERARVAAALNHPNIARAFDFGKVGGEYYVATDFIDGLSVEALLAIARERRRPPGAELAVHLGLRICDALAYAEVAPVAPPGSIYPRLTPADVAVGFDSLDVKLSHFGELELEPGISRSAAPYNAPEREPGGPPDPRTGIYSAGAIVFELATGVKPHRTGEPPAVPAPGSLVPGFPADLEQVVLRALATDPAKRFDSARGMLSTLEAVRAAHGWRDGKLRLEALLSEAAPGWRERRNPSFSLQPDGPNTEPNHAAIGQRRFARWGALAATALIIGVGAVALLRPSALDGLRASAPAPQPPKARPLTEQQARAQEKKQAGLRAMEASDYERAVELLGEAARLDPNSDAAEVLAIARELRDRGQVTPPPRSPPAADPAPPAAPTSPAPGP